MESGKERHSFRDLIVWQRAMDLVDLVYETTRTWPREELYGLTGQIRRAAVSIPSNIAEGQGRNGAKEFGHHLSMALGSLAELETQIMVAQRQGYLTSTAADRILQTSDEVGRLLNGLSRALASSR